MIFNVLGKQGGGAMVGRTADKSSKEKIGKPKRFDDFELRLGDIMRGERATLGKSLLDVQRDLRIKASYISAIESSDPQAFDTPGFIAGYVRSYARYLNMDPDKTFATFCEESGFSVAHGMSAEASVIKKPLQEKRLGRGLGADIFSSPEIPFAPVREGIFSGIEPRAVGSSVVLLVLIAAIAFGGYSVLQEVQRVQVAPVDQTPTVLSSLDPLNGVVPRPDEKTGPLTTTPRVDALNRLYRPQALEVPVLIARDRPIATLDPRENANFLAPELDTDVVVGQIKQNSSIVDGQNIPRVIEEKMPALQMIAVRPSWVRVRSADGTVIFETTMQAGETWEAPLTEQPPILRAGESGAIYFAINGKFYGPVGDPGQVTSNLPLEIVGLQETYLPVDISTDEGLVRYAEANATAVDTDSN